MEARRGYVAMLDVLGFSDLVVRESHPEELTKYINSARAATDATVESILFSDTVVMTTSDDSEDALLAILRSCSHAFTTLLADGVPVRGAIAHGSFFRYADRETGSVFLAGKPIVDAYRFEKAQDWIGINVGSLECFSTSSISTNICGRS